MNTKISIILPITFKENFLLSLDAVQQLKCDFIIYVVNNIFSPQEFENSVSRFYIDKRFIFLNFDKKMSFEEICNKIVSEVDKTNNDVLILSQYAIINSECIVEMVKAINLTEKNAVVFPRTNNAEYFGIPIFSTNGTYSYSKNIFNLIKLNIPNYYIVTFLFRFCYLIKRKVILLFGLFSKDFYNSLCSEFDFICRINSFGFSTLMINTILIENNGPRINFKSVLKDKKYNKLLSLYSYLNYCFSDFLDNEISPVDYFSSLFLADRKKRILINLYNMPSFENGTSIFGKNFLNSFTMMFSDKYEIFILITKEADVIHNISKKFKNVLYPTNILNNVFDLCFVPSQIFDFRNLYLINKTCLKYIFCMQDIIGIRCNYIRIENDHNITKDVYLSLKYANQVCGISRYSISDTKNFYKYKINFNKLKYTCVYHGLMKKENGTKKIFNGDVNLPFSEYILIFGNNFKHKAICETMDALKNNLSWNFVFFGGEINNLKYKKNIAILKSGDFSDSFMENLIKKAKLIIFPSLYEGFGIILFDAIIFNKRIIVNKNELNDELVNYLKIQNIRMFESFNQINDLIYDILNSPFIDYKNDLKLFSSSVLEYEKIIAKNLNEPIEVDCLKTRWEELENINSFLRYKNITNYNSKNTKNKFIIFIKNKLKVSHPKIYKVLKKCLRK